MTCWSSAVNIIIWLTNKELKNIKLYNLMKNIRNYAILNDKDIEFMNELSKDELLEIIKITNIHTKRIYELNFNT